MEEVSNQGLTKEVIKVFKIMITDVVAPETYYESQNDPDYFMTPILLPFLLRKIDPCSRVDVVMHLFKMLEDVERDCDQDKWDEICCGIGDLAVNLWIELGRIYDENDFIARQKLFDACMDYINEAHEFKDEVLDVLLDYDDERFFDRLKPFVEKEIERYPNHSGNYAACLLTILLKEGHTIEQLKEYAVSLESSLDIDNWFIDYYKKQWNLPKALELLDEMSKKWNFFKSDRDHFQKRKEDLIRHFAQSEHKDQAIKEYEKLIGQSYDSEIKYYRELKACFTPEQWESYRIKIFNLKKDFPRSLAKYFSEENLLDLLEELVYNPSLNVDLFDLYPGNNTSNIASSTNSSSSHNSSSGETVSFSNLKNLIQQLISKGEKAKVLDLYKVLCLQCAEADNDLGIYKNFKSLFTKDKNAKDKNRWDEFREDIFNWRKGTPTLLAHYFKENKLYERAAELLLLPKVNLELVNELAQYLPQIYEDSLISKYCELLSDSAKNARNMKDYRMIISALENCQKSPRGLRLARDLTMKWLGEYCYRDNFCFLLREFLDKFEATELPDTSVVPESKPKAPKASKANVQKSKKNTSKSKPNNGKY